MLFRSMVKVTLQAYLGLHSIHLLVARKQLQAWNYTCILTGTTSAYSKSNITMQG